MAMGFEEKKHPNVGIQDLFGNSADTIIFDENGNVFKISYNNGLEISITPDRLIDIL